MFRKGGNRPGFFHIVLHCDSLFIRMLASFRCGERRGARSFSLIWHRVHSIIACLHSYLYIYIYERRLKLLRNFELDNYYIHVHLGSSCVEFSYWDARGTTAFIVSRFASTSLMVAECPAKCATVRLREKTPTLRYGKYAGCSVRDVFRDQKYWHIHVARDPIKFLGSFTRFVEIDAGEQQRMEQQRIEEQKRLAGSLQTSILFLLTILHTILLNI